jgi:DNA-binding response OmpR family regulator
MKWTRFQDRRQVNVQIPSRALLVGLEPQLAGDLEASLSSLGFIAKRSPIEECGPLALRHEVIFAPDEPAPLKALVQLLRSLRMNGPVIVASRKDDTSSWLAALEAGADDYCSAPFEQAQLRWILESKLTPGPHLRSAPH